MDKPGADFYQALETVADRLKGNPVPVCIPLEDKSVINLVDETHITFGGANGEIVSVHPIPDEYEDLVAEHRETMLMAAAEQDEEITPWTWDRWGPKAFSTGRCFDLDRCG